MRVIFIGAAHRHGTSKLGKPYDMCKFTYAIPISPVTTATMNYHGFGYEPKEVDLEPSALNKFALCQIGETIDISVEPDPTNLTRNIVTGLIKPSTESEKTSSKF
ncbi:hypothetical protein [Aeromonas cavernicola]|uniref:Uncharacterized protein n=1 Tax=Aeromonas cavernicola TaxID=1006623 RepID=A0A2H9U471_9GAMM|nr:hypothetical protein [Aeromonas cavernicola]PJG58832.1 hypothetical protein CUC53_10415 [Aeromonas cavernicola]